MGCRVSNGVWAKIFILVAVLVRTAYLPDKIIIADCGDGSLIWLSPQPAVKQLCRDQRHTAKEVKIAAVQPQQSKPGSDRPAPDTSVSPSLEQKTLADAVDLAMTVGQPLMQNGAENQRVEKTVQLLGAGLGEGTPI